MSSPILVVEDDHDLASLVCSLLADDGYAPQRAVDGRDALEKLANSSRLPELILLDLMMPTMSGTEFRAAQLKDARLAGIPVVVMSGAPDAARTTIGLGVKECLSKPIRADVLLSAVSRHTKHDAGAAPAPVVELPHAPPRTAWLEALRDSPVSIFWCDRDGMVTLAAGNCKGQLGLEAEELMGRNIASLFPAVSMESGEATVEIEARGRRLEVYCKRVRAQAGDGEPEGSAFVVRDVTAHREALETVQRQKHEAQSILDALPAMIWLKDAENRIVLANRTAAASIGRTPAEVEGVSTFELYPELAQKYHEDDLSVIHSGAPKLDIVERYEIGPGVVRWVRTDKTPYRAKDGAVIGVVVAASDVTQWKLAEEERRQNDEQRRLLLDKLRELDHLRTRFFANVSHELRTPLALISGLCERLARTTMNANEQHDLALIMANLRTLTGYVNDLLDLAKLDAGRMRPRYARVDLMRLARRVIALFEPTAAERGVSLELEDNEPLFADVDSGKMQRILQNLVANALRHTTGGEIVFRVARIENRALLSVSDSGPGIPVALRARLFDRFYQVEHAANGAGLGLAIVKELTEIHRGTVRVDDTESGGARFTVNIPIDAPAGARVAAEEAAESEERIVAMPSSATGGVAQEAPSSDGARSSVNGRPTAKVVVVDDNREMNRFLSETLGDAYEVRSAFDGGEGLALIRDTTPDAIVTDVMMKRMHGDELVRQIRADHELDDIPILVLTAWADDALKERLLREGAQDYVTKPFTVAELLARVGNLVEMRCARRVLQRELSSSTADVARLATELAERGHDLARALDSMTAARDQAERASMLKASFTRLVTHELRTPLSTLTLGLDVLKRRATNPEVATGIDRCAASALRLQGLIESLLEHARIESGSMHLHLAQLDASVLIGETVEEHRPLAEAKGLELHCTADGPLAVTSDAKLLRLIAANLVSNAVKFTSHGHVSVTFEGTQDSIRLAVSDTGPGIAATDQARVFEPFAQLEALERKHIPGVGLGLALVREFVAVLGGTLELSSTPGQGATFTVTLPRASTANKRAPEAPSESSAG